MQAARDALGWGRQPVLIIDTESYVPPEDFRVVMESVSRQWHKEGKYSADELAFLTKVYERSGLGQEHTYLPPAIHPLLCNGKPRTDLAAAAEEARMAVCGAVEGLLCKTGLEPKDVDILVTTCSIYCPTPSMASMVVNAFGMRPDVQSYHLGGMGCANGVVAVSMVKDLLQAHPNANAVFVTTETTTPAYYPGHDKHRLVTNMLFRMGASAVLMSNKASWDRRAKYQLVANYRVHVGGQSNDAYSAIRYGPDEDGINGIYLGKNVVTEASLALTKALWQIGPKLLTPAQKARFAATFVVRKLLGPQAMRPYLPKFSGSVQHFLLHAGGAKVLDGLGKALGLEEHDLTPSRAVLHDYGNVSSSTTWYALGWIESLRGVRKGDTLLQVGVGSGIKCATNLWKALRDVDDMHEAWEHRADADRIEHVERIAQVTQACTGVECRHGVVHTAFRVLFLMLMIVFMVAVHLHLLATGITSEL